MFTLEELALKEKLENYIYIQQDLCKLKNRRHNEMPIEGKVITTYGINPTGGSGFSASSKVENIVIKRMSLDEKIAIQERELEVIDLSFEVLNDTEKEIINYIKSGHKMTVIAKKTNLKRSQVRHRRDTAIRKMTKYIKEIM